MSYTDAENLAMQVLRIESLDGAERVDGFDGVIVVDPIAPEARATLLATCPSGPAQEMRGEGDSDSDYLGGLVSVLDLPVERGAEALPPMWRALFAQAFSRAYETRLERLAAVSLARSHKQARLLSYGVGGFLDAHYDNQAGKILTQVLFLNEAWEDDWGGQLELLSSDDHELVLRSVSPTIGNSVINPTTPSAWHRVSPVRPLARSRRRSLLLEWYHER